MTAFDLIDSIFSRPAWRGAPGNQRHVTRDQLVYLRNLIDADPEAAKVTRGAPGSLVWMPAGRHKYVLTEDLMGDKHMLTRLSNIEASGMGSLF
jgi:hypothetical protein